MVETTQTFYAYVDGSDLDHVAEALTIDLQAFVEAEPWLGLHFSHSNVAEDVYFVDNAAVDLQELREALG